MNNKIVCHIAGSKYLYDLEKKKYYRYNKYKTESYDNPNCIIEKLKKTGKSYDWSIEDCYSDILEKTYYAHSLRKHYRFDLYQTPVLPETALRRALLVKEKCKNIILIGDDDLVSVPLALLGHNVTVLDIDEYLGELINIINDEFDINIKFYKKDLLDCITKDESDTYDILYSDPISTKEGFEVFLGKGLQMIKSDGTAFVAVTEKMQRVLEDYCKENNHKILSIYKRFCNSYNHKFEIIDDVANMVKIEKTTESIFKYRLNERCHVDFFSSQKNMRYTINIEMFGINEKNIDDEINNVINMIQESDFCFMNVSKYYNNNYDYRFIYDNSNKITMFILLNKDNDYVKFLVEVGVNYNIGKIKNLIKKSISHVDLVINQCAIGLPSFKERKELDINCLY